MKKFYTFLFIALMMLLPSVVLADSVNEQQALAKAMQFFSKGTQTRTAPQFELIWDGEEVATRATAEPAFFIFNRTDMPGFVIIAGDDSVSPVIGYSFENGFGKGEMPSNLRYWLEGVRGMILQARAAGAPAVDQTPLLGDVVKDLETADWDQDNPYNRDCPTYGGQKAVTGCSATAAAIVCKYHRWPETGDGMTPAYTTPTRGISVPARELGSYNYDLMPNVYKAGSFSDAEAAEVARLMADIGAGLKSDYAQPGGTGAYSTAQLRTMITYMRYNKAAYLAHRDGYTDDEWKRLLKAEIDANRPVLYSAVSSAGGHAFVMDGYTNDGLFCFNWGWSGQANGAYSINNMAPAGSGYNFTYGHEAIVDLWPDKEGATTYSDNLVVGAQENYVGLYVDTKLFATGTPFSTQLVFYNVSATNYSGRVAIALADKNYTIKELITAEQTVSVRMPANGLIYAGSISARATIQGEIKPGDRIIPVFWDRATKGWLRMRKYVSNAIDEVIVMEANPDGDAIASNTQISWKRTKKELSIQTYNGTTLEVLKGGSKVHSTTVGAEPVVLSNLAAGSYTVRIYFDADEACEFKLTL